MGVVLAAATAIACRRLDSLVVYVSWDVLTLVERIGCKLVAIVMQGADRMNQKVVLHDNPGDVTLMRGTCESDQYFSTIHGVGGISMTWLLFLSSYHWAACCTNSPPCDVGPVPGCSSYRSSYSSGLVTCQCLGLARHAWLGAVSARRCACKAFLLEKKCGRGGSETSQIQPACQDSFARLHGYTEY